MDNYRGFRALSGFSFESFSAQAGSTDSFLPGAPSLRLLQEWGFSDHLSPQSRLSLNLTSTL
jgi:hypothetical protein